MSEKGYTGVFLAALFVGVVATASVYQLVVRRTPMGTGEGVTTVPVVVAASEISEGMLLSAPMLRVRPYMQEAVPRGAFTDIDSLAGRVARLPIFPGEAVLESKLAAVGAGAGLEVKIHPGNRAMAIPVNDHVGISGLIQPNSRVDVLVTLRPDRNRSQRMAKVFLQNIRVLSVGQQMIRGDDGDPIAAKTVTLELTPAEAEMLAVAMNEGVLHLALRGFADSDSIRTTGATPLHVLAAANRIQTPRRRRTPPPKKTEIKTPPPPPPVETVPAWMKVQIYRGRELTEQEVELEDSVEVRDTSSTGSPRSNNRDKPKG